MKIDPYNHKEKYLKWKGQHSQTLPGISTESSHVILEYLADMERGMNIAAGSVRGPRSYSRLISLRQRMAFFAQKFEELYGITRMTDINEVNLLSFFSDMRIGNIKKKDGGYYKSLDTTGKAFKAFWHWWQKVNKKRGVEIPDITVDLDTRTDKPDWVYLTEIEVKKLCDAAKPIYRMLMMFLFDTGMRAPTELMNIKISDLHNEYKEVNIRDEVSKTFGRRIKLMLCSDLLKEYIRDKKLTSEDYLFTKSHYLVNKYLKRLAVRVLGDKETPAGAKTSVLSMYDFRHISCCYWLPRYKSESALKYRFGWKKSERIHYYSELLGMKDTISEDDMLVDLTRTEIERRLERSEKARELLSEKVDSLQLEINELKSAVVRLLAVAPTP